MKSKLSSLLAIVGLIAGTQAFANGLTVKGFNLTEGFEVDKKTGRSLHPFSANLSGKNTEAQDAVDYIYELGARHVVLNTVAHIPSITASEIVPVIQSSEIAKERKDIVNLMKYIHSKGMTVGIRPIMLLKPGASKDKEAFHGNIRPEIPAEWFKSLRSYLDIYITCAKMGKAEEFTVGAELYSMSLGAEDLWKEQPFGFPREWAALIKDIKKELGDKTRMMYDINFTDVASKKDGSGKVGGEIERFRFRLVDLKPKPGSKDQKEITAWETTRDFWNAIDVIGVDLYPSLMTNKDSVPADFDQLSAKLKERVSKYYNLLDGKLAEIEEAIGSPKKVILKEIGFKSSEKGFIDSYEYDDAGKKPNVMHQAAAYKAFMETFIGNNPDWLMGVSFWDVSVDRRRSGVTDPGFSPRGKKLTEEVIKKHW